MNKTARYNIINTAVILATAVLFVRRCGDMASAFAGRGFLRVGIFLLAAILVHMVKAGRLYLALYGTELPLSVHLKLYCKVVPVSMIVPFKLGEFFRMYCYGQQLGSALKGVVIILLERVMDTLALVTMILLMWLFGGTGATALVYVFLIFLMAVILAWYAFPGLYGFWKTYLLRAKASEGRLRMLVLLDVLGTIYSEAKSVAKGRGIILYVMSLVAWAVEMGSVALLDRLKGENRFDEVVNRYLLSAMAGGSSDEMGWFVGTSVILLMAVYMLIKAMEYADGKKAHR